MTFFKVLPKENLKSACLEMSCNRSSRLRESMKKSFLRRPATLLKETLAEVFSCE